MRNYKLTSKIEVSEQIYLNMYEYEYGKRKNEMVCFYYNHIKRGLTIPRRMTYNKALHLAFDRAHDGRYKNYKFYISDYEM